jgi:hypothetical protein
VNDGINFMALQGRTGLLGLSQQREYPYETQLPMALPRCLVGWLAGWPLQRLAHCLEKEQEKEKPFQ